MIDIDVARRLQQAGLDWDPHDGDRFAVDTEDLRTETFLLSSMVIEAATGRGGQQVFRFNGTTEWALDSVQQHETIWLPREDQLRAALGDVFRELQREADGTFVVRWAEGDAVREVRAPHAEDAYAGALLVHLGG